MNRFLENINLLRSIRWSGVALLLFVLLFTLLHVSGCREVPVDRVVGLVDGGGDSKGRPGESLVIERRPVDGRIVHILDPMTLVARGGEVIESATH